MKHESHIRLFRSKHLCSNTNPNLGPQCKEKSWAEEILTGSWAPRFLWWENVEEMGGKILGYNSVECIRVTILDWISLNQYIWIWFDSLFTTCQICQISIFLHMILYDSSLMMIMVIIPTWNSQKILGNQSLGFYMI